MAAQTKPTVTREMKMDNTAHSLADQSAMWFIASLFVSLPGALIVTALYLLGVLSFSALLPVSAAVLSPLALAIFFALAALTVKALVGKGVNEQWATFYQHYEQN